MFYEEIRTLRTLGMSDLDIRKSAKNYQTYNFTAPIGSITSQTLQIPGTAVVMLGIIVTTKGDCTGDSFTLRLNNEVLLENMATVQVGGLNPGNQYFPLNNLGYTELTRRMSGRDTLTVDYSANSQAQTIVSFTVVYLTSYTSALRK